MELKIELRLQTLGMGLCLDVFLGMDLLQSLELGL